MSHAVRGAELEHFLEVGSCRVPVLPSAPLKRTVIVDLDFREDEDDPEKLVFGDHCSLKVLGKYHDCCGAHIEVYRNGIKA